MKDTRQLRQEATLVNNGIADLLKSLGKKRPMSTIHVVEVLEDLLMHSGAVLFQLDCIEEVHQLAAKDYHPGT